MGKFHDKWAGLFWLPDPFKSATTSSIWGLGKGHVVSFLGVMSPDVFFSSNMVDMIQAFSIPY